MLNDLITITNTTRNTVLADQCMVANDPNSKRAGLLSFDSLAPGEGLYLTPPASRVHTHGMRFNIDLVFVNRTGKVTSVRRGVGQGRVEGDNTASAVLELPVGVIDGSRTVAGDQLSIS